MITTEGILEAKTAEKFRAQGFEVIVEPEKENLPFDLGTYRPDLIAKKSAREGYIIEVKSSALRTPVERFREIAEAVSQHEGWRFLLVTGEDIPSLKQENGNDGLLTWAQISQREKHAEHLLSLEEHEGAFMTLWGTLEAILRHQASRITIPIERFPTLSLVKHLYSQGELSIEQFDKLKELQDLRNRFVHGYQIPNLDQPAKQLQKLVAQLHKSWEPAS